MDMSTAERELQRRRERGRQSQASFRKRQAQAAQHLTANNRQLKDAIGKIINAARTNKYPELLETIFDAAEGAGIDFKRPIQFDAHNSHSKFAAASRPQILPEHLGTGGITAVDHHTNSGPAFPVVPALPLVAPQQLSWGIWLDPLHYMRASLPPEDIIPYLGQGSKTFAGRLFWSVMEHSQIKCEREHSDRFTLIRRGLRHSKATQDLGSPFIQATVEARLEYKRIGSISPQYALAGEADLGVVLRDQIEKDYRSRGKDPSLWLSSLAIERRLRIMVGNATFGLLEMAARGEGSPPLRDLMDRVKCALYETCDCFGDGPRWNVNVVDGLFLDWIAEASSL